MFNGYRVFILLFCFLIPTLALADEQAGHDHGKREECPVCGMWIDQYQKTAGEVVHKDGKIEHTCGVACLLRLVLDEGEDRFSSLKVTDWTDHKLVDAHTASYVIGSKVIPDMIPNVIAFETREKAEAFQAKKGGEVISFAGALRVVGPRPFANPFRIQPAVTNAEGAFQTSIGVSYGTKDQVMLGSASRDPTGFIKGNNAQPRAPKSIQTFQQVYNVNYGITDDLTLLATMPFLEKRAVALVRNPKTKQINEVATDNNGPGDLNLRWRYNLWRSVEYDKWFTLYLGMTLPTGYFDPRYLASPGLQLGKGTATFEPGLLYSQRIQNFWINTSATYLVNPVNQHYKYGDQAILGLGIHYTPSYSNMVGVQFDAFFAQKNECTNQKVCVAGQQSLGAPVLGSKIGNTGGNSLNINFVGDWRFLNALGGNFVLRANVGLPLYQDLNDKKTAGPAGQYTQTQLGGGWYGSLSISYATRFVEGLDIGE